MTRSVLPARLLQSLYVAVLLLVCIIGPAVAAQVIRTDPNTPEAAASREEPEGFWADPRLSQPVTYEARIKPVRDILDDLTDLTGVKLNPGYNSNDWQVRDRRMVIFAKDLPLKDLMQSIARTMKFKWSRSEHGGVWTYRLWMDRKTLLGEEAQRYREEQREKDYIRRQRGKLVDVMEKSSQFTDEELARMKESDPYRYALVKSGLGSAMADLMRAAPEMRDALRSGSEYRADEATLSVEAQEALAKLAKASNRMEFYQRDDEQSRAVLEELSNHPERAHVWLNCSDEVFQPGDPRRQLLLGSVQVSYRNPPDPDGVMTYSSCSRMDFLDPDNSIAHFYGESAARVIDGEASASTVMAEAESKFVEVLGTARKTADWGEPPVKHPSDPALERVASFELPKTVTPDGREQEHRDYADVLSAFAEGAQYSVVSDYFYQSDAYKEMMGQWQPKARIIDALSYIEQSFDCNWWKRDSILELRDRYWFTKRATQVPDEWLDRWMGELERTGFIELDNLAQICSLTPEQFVYNFDIRNSVNDLRWTYQQKSTNHLLRFYASLSRSQKDMLLNSRLDVRVLSEAQWDKLRTTDAHTEWDNVVSITAQRRTHKMVLRDADGKEQSRGVAGYEFIGFADDGGMLWDMDLVLPSREKK